MLDLPSIKYQCPYCWEQIESYVDCSEDEQEYVEDCFVCCNPIIVSVISHEGAPVGIDIRKENE